MALRHGSAQIFGACRAPAGVCNAFCVRLYVQQFVDCSKRSSDCNGGLMELRSHSTC